MSTKPRQWEPEDEDIRKWEVLDPGDQSFGNALYKTLWAEPKPTCDADMQARLGDFIGLLAQDGWMIDHPFYLGPPSVSMKLLDVYLMRPRIVPTGPKDLKPVVLKPRS